ncbi:MAG: hypothetical protein EPN91_07270 [Salinibacterium sp.]|nr:MAG: hypothetical protein EPN91_07270 [Salinibacterium sp.]
MSTITVYVKGKTKSGSGEVEVATPYRQRFFIEAPDATTPEERDAAAQRFVASLQPEPNIKHLANAVLEELVRQQGRMAVLR